MKSVSGRDFARIIERRGWTLLRVSGSHHIYGKSGSIVRLSVPIHGSKPLKTGLCGIWQSSPSFQTKIFRPLLK
jgi:predicted RNA binding protein YcfA (HicA-like mRNA interferase family)